MQPLGWTGSRGITVPWCYDDNPPNKHKRGLLSADYGLPNVRYIVELGDNGVEEFWSSESALRLNLRTEMSQDDDGRHVRSYQDRSYQELEVRKPLGIAELLASSQRL